MAVPANSPFKTIKDLVEHARSNPGKLAYGSPGVFSGNHVVGASIEHDQRIKLNHIPYKSDSENTNALLGGQIESAVVANVILPYVQSGKVRVLATTDSERNPAFGNVPTLTEAGLNVVVPSPLGLAGPAGLPRDIVAVLEKAVQGATTDPAVKGVLDNLGLRQRFMGSQQYAEFAKKTFAAEKSIVEIMK